MIAKVKFKCFKSINCFHSFRINFVSMVTFFLTKNTIYFSVIIRSIYRIIHLTERNTFSFILENWLKERVRKKPAIDLIFIFNILNLLRLGVIISRSRWEWRKCAKKLNKYETHIFMANDKAKHEKSSHITNLLIRGRN